MSTGTVVEPGQALKGHGYAGKEDTRMMKVIRSVGGSGGMT